MTNKGENCKNNGSSWPCELFSRILCGGGGQILTAEGVERRLAAILAADVVSFSRMMSLREEETLRLLNALRDELFDPRISKSGGRTIKLMGDGVLCEFSSAVAAVKCAIDIQQALSAQNNAVPDEQKIELRIGVNVGDVIVQGHDIYGHGVNIAARLESIAHPGEVLISDAVFQQVAGTEDLSFVDLGEQDLKNIPDPVRVYRVSLGQNSRSVHVDVRYLLSKPAVAVLPFTNMTGDPEQEYFSDGLTEDIVTALSHWKEFPVIARSSSFTYKGKAVDVRQVSRGVLSR
jgi:class 3 adenylate cyclase